MISIYITGYPRSGNTWLGRLLADVLGCGYVYQAGGIPEFTGDKTEAPYLVHKLHALNTPDVDHTVYIYRDPRDVAVSVAHYRHNGDLLMAIEDMTHSVELWGVGRYLDMVESWWYSHRAAAEVRYCDLHETPLITLALIVTIITGVTPEYAAVQQAIDRQALPNVINKYAPSNHIRNGQMDEWRKCFTREAAQLFDKHFGQLLIDQEFEPDRAWLEKYA